MQQQRIFSDKYIKNKLRIFSLDAFERIEYKRQVINEVIGRIKTGRTELTKEKSQQADFLNSIFGEALDYEYKDGEEWNLEKEKTTVVGGKYADGALGYYSIRENKICSEIRVIIELKDANTDLDKPQNRTDKRTPVEQAFGYVPKSGGNCSWVIVSNFKEIRLYHSSDESRYEKFYLLDLVNEEKLKYFLFLLHKDRLILKTQKSRIDNLYAERQSEEKKISETFYKEYKFVRNELFNHLKINNEKVNDLILFGKAQKILDRIIFICFCEDLGLLPDNVFRNILKTSKDIIDFSEAKLWSQVKNLFKAIDKGYPDASINKFNGGLFSEDKILDELIIKDEIIKHIINLSEYDFESDLNVNILGHIFEQSISDIEEIKAQIEGQYFDDKKGKRKRDGIFYTPEYITRFIVKETVGRWLEDRKIDLGIETLPTLAEEDYKSIQIITTVDKGTRKKVQKLSFNKKIEKHIHFWEAYREKLSNIKVLDPACGSGAFLNQVFNFLYLEGELVNKELANLKLGQRETFDLDKHILTNNIFGVDLNGESVEITKLSLWLKTANKYKELTSLDENIKCGNSIIYDKTIAGSTAFKWEENYPKISSSGFDIIIGNPPYGAKLEEKQKLFLSDLYACYKGNQDIYSVFFQLAFQKLSSTGYFGYIIPVSWQSGELFYDSRKFLKENGQIKVSIKLPYDVFPDAYVDTGIYIIKNQVTDKDESAEVYEFPVKYDCSNEIISGINYYLLPNSYWQNLQSLKIVLNPSFYELLPKVHENTIPLSEISFSIRGILASDNDFSDEEKASTYKPFFSGDLSRYVIREKYKWVNYGDNLKEKPKDYSFFQGNRILIRRLISRQFRVMAMVVEKEFVNKKDLYNLKISNDQYDIKYILAIINSKLISFLKTKGSTNATKDDFSQLTLGDVREIPIKILDLELQKPICAKVDFLLQKKEDLKVVVEEVSKYILLKFPIAKPSMKITNWPKVQFAELLIELKKNKFKLTSDQEFDLMTFFNKKRKFALDIKSSINRIEDEIDNLIYEFYNLNSEERKIVENSFISKGSLEIESNE